MCGGGGGGRRKGEVSESKEVEGREDRRSWRYSRYSVTMVCQRMLLNLKVSVCGRRKGRKVKVKRRGEGEKTEVSGGTQGIPSLWPVRGGCCT